MYSNAVSQASVLLVPVQSTRGRVASGRKPSKSMEVISKISISDWSEGAGGKCASLKTQEEERRKTVREKGGIYWAKDV